MVALWPKRDPYGSALVLPYGQLTEETTYALAFSDRELRVLLTGENRPLWKGGCHLPVTLPPLGPYLQTPSFRRALERRLKLTLPPPSGPPPPAWYRGLLDHCGQLQLLEEVWRSYQPAPTALAPPSGSTAEDWYVTFWFRLLVCSANAEALALANRRFGGFLGRTHCGGHRWQLEDRWSNEMDSDDPWFRASLAHLNQNFSAAPYLSQLAAELYPEMGELPDCGGRMLAAQFRLWRELTAAVAALAQREQAELRAGGSGDAAHRTWWRDHWALHCEALPPASAATPAEEGVVAKAADGGSWRWRWDQLQLWQLRLLVDRDYSLWPRGGESPL